jgi:hypothetical protein
MSLGGEDDHELELFVKRGRKGGKGHLGRKVCCSFSMLVDRGGSANEVVDLAVCRA